jgi:hypothetical protein
VFLLDKDNLLPTVLTIPPSSIKPVQTYLLRLSSQALPFWSVVTKFALEKTKNSGGIAYSRVVPSLAERLTEEQAVRVRQYIEALEPALRAASNSVSGSDFSDPTDHDEVPF